MISKLWASSSAVEDSQPIILTGMVARLSDRLKNLFLIIQILVFFPHTTFYDKHQEIIVSLSSKIQ
jgi:radical SAM superfamily enzyme YgiQ (UPF0313 family)